MNKQESKFQTKFNQWVKDNFHHTACFELKHTKGSNSISFDEVKDHQIRALRIARHGQLVYKIADDSIGYKVFDCFSLFKVPAYVVIKYPKFFVMITVDAFVLEKSRSERKSLTGSRAKEIAFRTVDNIA